MMRHSQKQTYRGGTTTLMSLPPRRERIIRLNLPKNDADEYAELEEKSRNAFLVMKASLGNAKKIGRKSLAISKLMRSMRVACAGGRAPLISPAKQPQAVLDGDSSLVHTASLNDEEEEEEQDEDSEAEAEEGAAAIGLDGLRDSVTYSNHVFTGKAAVLVAELKRVRDEDDTAKSLIFSQFPSTLRWLKEELPKHGFQFRTLSGDMSLSQRTVALRDFRNDPPTTVFLLSMRAGAVGINLTQANRVFLLEPCFNPALEHQAIGRVHRLGQKRSVEVIRLVVNNSIESRMVKILEKKYGKYMESKVADSKDEGTTKQQESTKNSIAGSIARDKPDMVAYEYDVLFGITEDENER
eukprot:CAMPEP_0118678498 /NCGR_PEP_ID=MMETSP0800-20121206/3254_1 /TAXON_ID=210618 ORGANISM="Striatella unipunctata, Strain CCMP2910" /NCGR_SAMPLE_ID=MMETSP0800 /ASSEMBLY_ACC=CAM_ASM_000638 /LENGTH=353 /DNA_ID=CAMNT_0006574365 /DNA_START=247 /DNA_END=1308 /DNA_ORIENTATION=+